MDRKFKIDFHEFSFLVEACIPKDNLKEFKELEWKDIPNYEGFYVVSENGDVISLNRYIMRSNGYKQFIHSKLLEPITNKRGYLVLTLANEGKLKTLKVHQIVAMTFLNHLPNGMNKVVDHIDNNKLNNHKSNLQIITTPQNSRKELKGKTSKYHGVFWSNEKSKWRSAIIHKKKLIHLGYFNDEQEASDYYNAAVEKTENDDYDNIRIKKRKTSSKYKGVSYSKNNNKWRASFRYKNKYYSAGFFDDEEDAYKAYLNLYNKIKNDGKEI